MEEKTLDKSMPILVVEDSQLLQKGYELIFRRYKTQGCQVLHAYYGREGLVEAAGSIACQSCRIGMVCNLQFMSSKRSRNLP